ncbi:MAG TPA: ATP-binding protein [Gemmatimonadaceae bacterium]|nr:ATP-binding protein [Gemmatimonadaceae bacterium]
MSLFFFGGIHGAGKSTLCEALKGPLDAVHLRASDLIGYVAEPGDLMRKAVVDVGANQELALSALTPYLTSSLTILLDGHYCLVRRDASIVNVPLDVFTSIRPLGLVLVEAPTFLVKQRLERREGSSEYQIEFLTRLTQVERQQAEFVSSSLNVPLKIWRHGMRKSSVLTFARRLLVNA